MSLYKEHNKTREDLERMKQERAGEAVKKQISISRDVREGRYYCPVCKKEMSSGYCRCCGQKLY